MMKMNSLSLILVFSVSFICFLLGWLFAVFVLPGKKTQISTETKQIEEILTAENPDKEIEKQALLSELKNNVLILFDPYKIDNFLKKDSKLEKKNSFIKNSTDILLKKNVEKPSAHPSNFQQQKLNTIKEIELSEKVEFPISEKLSLKLQAIQDEYDKKNKEHLLLIEKDQKFFKTTGKFSFMINVFSEQDKAFEFVKEMKQQYPMWSFLLKVHKDHIRVYLGPFPSKELANEFKKSIPQPLPFSSLDFLTEVSL